MKERRNIRYISGRIWWMGMAVLALLVILTVTQAVLFFQGQGPLWNVLLTVAVLIGYLIAAVFWISRPYQQAEKTMERFLEGYMVMAGDGARAALLTPTTAEEMKFMEHFLHSPQMMDLNKRQAQYLALQNQINPHFLYNTLESIRSEAMEAGMDSVVCMTEALAHFFRYTISNMENMVTLEEELDNINTYFLIQKYRFEERIGLTIEYDEEEHDLLNHCLLPKLTLQPVVENSIIHGIERKMGFSTVRIVLRCTEKRLIIQVSDDGIGMQPEALDDLNRKLNQSLFESLHNKKKKGGIALVNVNNRIHLIFGEEYGMTVYSTPGVGTDVMIELPLVTNRRELKKVDFDKV